MRDKFLEYILLNAVREGEFKMAGGQTSNILIDLSGVLRSAKGQKFITECYPKELLELDFDTIGGPLSGSDLVSSALCNSYLCDSWFGVRSAPKNRGLDTDCLTGNIKPESKVLLVEDVITTGGNALRAAAAITEYGSKILGVFCVVDRGGMQKVQDTYNIPGFSIFTLKDIEDNLI